MTMSYDVMSTEDRQQNHLQRDSRGPGVAKPELLTCPSILLIAPPIQGGFGESVHCKRIALHRPKREGRLVGRASFWAHLFLGEVDLNLWQSELT